MPKKRLSDEQIAFALRKWGAERHWFERSAER